MIVWNRYAYAHEKLLFYGLWNSKLIFIDFRPKVFFISSTHNLNIPKINFAIEFFEWDFDNKYQNSRIILGNVSATINAQIEIAENISIISNKLNEKT